MLLLAATLPRAAMAAPREYQGEAVVAVVGGNLVSARRRALVAAQRNALDGALSSLLGEAQATALDPKVRRKVHRRSASYVQTYRVLDEGQQDDRFRLQVAVVLAIKRLQSDLARHGVGPMSQGGGAPEDRSGATAGEATVGVLLAAAPANRAAVVSRITRELHRAGLKSAVLGSGDGGQASDLERARRAGVRWLLRLELRVEAGEGVRGLDWSGAHARGSFRLQRVADGEALGEASCDRWAAEQRSADAVAEAARQCVEQGLSPLVRRVRGVLKRAASAARAGTLQVTVQRVGSAEHYRRLDRALGRGIVGVSRCELRRASPGRLVWAVRFSGTSQALARMLVGRSYEGFSLRKSRVAPAGVWLDLVPTPPSTGEAAPAAAGEESP